MFEVSVNSVLEGNMLRVIQDLFLAGSETTSTTLDWALLYMIEYPEIQRKCQLEIEQVVTFASQMGNVLKHL